MDLLNTVFSSIVGGFQGTTDALLQYALPILYFSALCWMAWGIGGSLMQGGSHLGETLGNMVFRLMTIGFYSWVLANWKSLTSSIVGAMVFWGAAGGNGGIDPQTLLSTPGVIWQTGQVAVAPIINFDTWAKAMGAPFALATSPVNFVSYMLTLVAFFSLCLSHGMLLIEIAICVAMGSVLLPWSLLRPVGHLGEAWVSWFTGAAVRTLVSVALMSAALPAIQNLAPAADTPSAIPSGTPDILNSAGGFADPLSGAIIPTSVPQKSEVLALVGASLIFAILAWVLPGRAARLAGSALGLTGGDVTSGIVTAHRIAGAGVGVFTGAARGASRLVSGMRL
ncbi:MAG TPA: type IV secretion system protein [Candidatus Saccharimonadia bacterium]|nr:type IV secretion system protein [Candidatus Saccharimonadia bacterium]